MCFFYVFVTHIFFSGSRLQRPFILIVTVNCRSNCILGLLAVILIFDARNYSQAFFETEIVVDGTQSACK